ncbi:SLAP domain-containing protein [Companilactobacillus sp.]|jgi:hypothetical protein|uniref:SLAP domain-containing protein n=1 Tax=Companilactobacillus sp. TaxID=2767905 RepID=UPI0025BD8182|nr:SLAP domain-containing protein [Companilactobacillus sp.]MCH4009305.1 DUF5011 domain-containing protein [Companilactobacillus sp.]MCH4050516.1 DUF5011 domain-containing protein [Companilactobacillus sp.]MCH4077247.1 DUF5011 domain-containing protein [Companilactobacillus sp.]MCH4125823.1 DUF5011 domain-containing protein [Companilactobacillus sp.]MCI1311532.1 DUF5011 domain-containing protein [Companilactobacillus sp.]
MKKTKRFVVTSAIVASMALGTVTTAATAQTSQAASITDTVEQIISQLQGGGTTTSTTQGVDVSKLEKVSLPAGTDPTPENIETAIGGTPTFGGLIPAKATIKDKNNVEFTADTSKLGTLGNILSTVLNKIKQLNVTIPIVYTSTLTAKDGSTTLNVAKGDSNFDLTSVGNYNVNPEKGAKIKVISNGGLNYAYAGTYNATVQATYDDGSAVDSAEVPITVNVLDANWSNADQTIVKGSTFDPSTVNATDSLGNPLDVTVSGKVDTSKAKDYSVTYTGTDKALGYNQKPLTFTKQATIHVVDADSSQTINFQDANSGDIVDTTTITGADGQVKAVDAPAGYDFVNTSDATVTLQKGSHASTVKVVKTGSSVETPFSGTVATYANGGIVPLYTGDGTQTSRSLSPNSDWATDQTKTINGEKYYRVSTSEWVKASTVYEYSPVGSTITTNAGSNKSLYSIKGNKSSRALAPNTPWYTDKSTTINGTQMYRVSTDEWVIASDVH